MNFFKVFLLLGLFMATSLSGLHLVWRFRTKPTCWLGIFIGLVGASILYILLVDEFYKTQLNPLILLPLNLIFLPVFFLSKYLSSLVKVQLLPHTILKTLYFIGLLEVSLNLLPTGAWIYTDEFNGDLIAFIFSIKRIFLGLLFPVGLFILIKFGIYFLQITQESDLEKAIKQWGKRLVIASLLMLLCILMPEVLRLFKKKQPYIYIFQAFISFFYLQYIAFFGRKFHSRNESNNRNLSSSDGKMHFEKLEQILINEKLYLQSDLRIRDLSDRIALSPNYVSAIINDGSGSNFNDWINQYRVQEVILKLGNQEHLHKSIVALAYESGFHSKSTFQSAFKKWTGKTPTQFLKESESNLPKQVLNLTKKS